MYWLPKMAATSTHLILSTSNTDTRNIKELLEERQFDSMEVSQLTSELRSKVTKGMLMVRGKELSPKQMEKVTGNQETGNPLYLFILLQVSGTLCDVLLTVYTDISYNKAKKKKLLCCPHPTKIWKLGRSVGIFFFFFFFFLRTVRELSFPIFFKKFLNGENSGRMQSKRIYKSCKCFFKPLNTNFSKFFTQIWHKKK